MNTKTKTQGIFKNLMIIFILIGASAAVSGYENVVLELSFEKSTVDPDEDAVLIVEIENEENDNISVDIEIWDDDNDVKLESDTQNINKGETKEINYTLNDFPKWDPYICESRTIRVEVENEEKSKTLTVSGDDFTIKISPAEPSISDEITITVLDELDDEVSGKDIIITNLDTDDSITDSTDSNGKFEFTPDEEYEFKNSPAGTYEVMVDNSRDTKEGYCSTKKTFSLKYKVDKSDIEVVDPKLPDVPKVNDQVTIKITTTDDKPARLANVTVSGPNFNKNYQTDSDGLFYFLPESVGNYDVKITDKNYVAVTKTIGVAAQTQLSISFSSDPEVGKELIVIVKADSKAVDGAALTLTDPEGKQKSLTTGSDGKAAFDALKLTGEYTITAKKSGYADATKNVPVYILFKITVPESANVGDTVKVKVLDKNDDPVKDAAVTGENFDLNKRTNSDGIVEFRIDELKDHKISIEKTGFTTVEKTINVEGKLIIKLTPENPQKNNDLTVTILAGGMPIKSNIKITKPGSTTENVDDSTTYTFKPEQVGKYTVTASKEGYPDVSLDFNIKENLMKVQCGGEGKLICNVTSDDKPISGAEVGIYTTTDENGIAVLEFNNNYNVSVAKENYETKKGAIQISGGRDYLKILMAIFILILILIILILILRGKKDKTEISGFKR